VSLQVTTIMLAVEDLSRAKKFYGEGMGCAIDKDFPQFVSFTWVMARRHWPCMTARHRRKTLAYPPRARASEVFRFTTSSRQTTQWTR